MFPQPQYLYKTQGGRRETAPLDQLLTTTTAGSSFHISSFPPSLTCYPFISFSPYHSLPSPTGLHWSRSQAGQAPVLKVKYNVKFCSNLIHS